MNPFKFGLNENYSFDENRRTYLGNIVNLFNIFILGLINLSLAIKYESIILYPCIMIFMSVASLILTSQYQQQIGKIVTVLGSFISLYLWNISINAGLNDINYGQILILMGYSVLPFGLFDFKNKFTVSFATLSLILSYTVPFFSDLISVTQNTIELGNDPVLTYSGFFLGGVVIYLGMFGTNRSQSLTELNNNLLREDIEKHNQELEESQQKLTEQLEEAQKVQQQEKNRAWVIEGLGRINNLIRNHDDPKKLAESVISEIVTYLGANQGSIFLLEEDDETSEKYLELHGAYAFDRKKFVEKRISIGEGLVGQAYLEAEPIILKDIPSNYINITSGLGDSTPGFLVIYPLINNDKVEAIIEVASFYELEDYKMDYLADLGESLASSFSLSKINFQTKYLLELSKQQEEEMRSQAEELQQNMEELQATQEEMARKAKEVEEQNDQLRLQEEAMRQNMEELQTTQEEMDRKAVEIEEQNNRLREQEEIMQQHLEELESQKDEMERYMKKTEDLKQDLQVRQNVLDVSTILSESDPYGTITYANDKLVEVSKYSREELIGSPHKIFRHPDVPSKLFKKLWDTIQKGETFRGIIKNRAKDGSVYWVDAIISPELDTKGKPVKYIGARYVIEDHKYAEQAFERQMKNFK
ncbi:PAS domain-containing protein [Mangrovivirga sp. M17]|uniref:PAS domain-containing protein n=1 Tax=Mangrovivirga halotolerans TaxID=2993936 RepID=A0ABT3RLH7_9BACT|nr:PAS domain-containing protein [Mangrovivirga halotolerans]MCX2742441.1 PAS domain-containing protein [Mangrovivirga halotolerans]